MAAKGNKEEAFVLDMATSAVAQGKVSDKIVKSGRYTMCACTRVHNLISLPIFTSLFHKKMLTFQ